MAKDRSIPALFSTVAPYLGVGFLLMGMVRLCLYYLHFGVNIVHFISLSEIITSLLDIGVGFIVVLSCILFVVLSIIIFSNTSGKKGTWLPKITFETDIRMRQLFALLFATFIGMGYWDGLHTLQILDMCLVVVSLAFGVLALRLWSMNARKPRTSNSRLFYVLIFATCVSIAVSSAVHEMHAVRYRYRYYGTTVVLENNRTFVSDSNQYYIGKTNQYLYLYHAQTNVTEVIPMNAVKQLTLAVDTLTPNICPLPDSEQLAENYDKK